MSTYPNCLGKGLNDIFESCAEREELDLPSGEFVARNGKAFNLTLLVASLVSITVGALLLIFFERKDRNFVFSSRIVPTPYIVDNVFVQMYYQQNDYERRIPRALLEASKGNFLERR